jgi:hypothetical protein
VLIDWDALKEGNDIGDARRDANRLLRQIQALKGKLPDEPPGYLDGVLGELQDALDELKDTPDGGDADEETL